MYPTTPLGVLVRTSRSGLQHSSLAILRTSRFRNIVGAHENGRSSGEAQVASVGFRGRG